MEPKKIGIVVMFKLNAGGGAPRVVVDLIKSLNEFGHSVYFLSPWKLDHKRIEEIYEPIPIEKEYNLDEKKKRFALGRNLSRIMIKNEFITMASEVDMIIDVDGGILDRYLPEDKKYVVWRISAINPQKSPWEEKNWKLKIKEIIRKIIEKEEDHPSPNHKIYAVDDWTRESLIKKWRLHPEKLCLYPEIKTHQLSYNKKIKKNQAIILGRIVPNKWVDDSIKIFARGTEGTDYELKIVGGVSPDTEEYIEYLKKVAQDYGVVDKVAFVKNPSFELLKEHLEKSKVVIDSQRDISLTMTAIESLACGTVVLVHKNSGTFKEVLDNGKFGFGFETIAEGARKLKEIIHDLEKNKIDLKLFAKRAEFFSGKKFRERLKQILKAEGI